jgi:hypothetical protein
MIKEYGTVRAINWQEFLGWFYELPLFVMPAIFAWVHTAGMAWPVNAACTVCRWLAVLMSISLQARPCMAACKYCAGPALAAGTRLPMGMTQISDDGFYPRTLKFWGKGPANLR